MITGWNGLVISIIELGYLKEKKGYGTKILSLALEEFRRLGFKEVYGQSSAGNIGSAKVIENNGGILIDEKDGTRYYKIVLK